MHGSGVGTRHRADSAMPKALGDDVLARHRADSAMPKALGDDVLGSDKDIQLSDTTIDRRPSRSCKLTAARRSSGFRREVSSVPVLIATVVSVDPFGHRPHAGTAAGFLVLAAFLISFLAIRTSARLTRSVSWWPGGVKSGGVHIHHLVWGICLMMTAGFLAFAAPLQAPWWHIVAIAFGIGVGFTLDEFALWVRLEDVYWSEEGRASLDAVVVAAAFAALVVLGTNPFGLDDPASILGTAAAVTVILGLAVTCFLKGRVMLGVIGLFVPVVALAGALRLAHPSSPWARWRYSGARLEEARQRFAPSRRAGRWERRVADLLAGAPTPERSAAVAPHSADGDDSPPFARP